MWKDPIVFYLFKYWISNNLSSITTFQSQTVEIVSYHVES